MLHQVDVMITMTSVVTSTSHQTVFQQAAMAEGGVPNMIANLYENMTNITPNWLSFETFWNSSAIQIPLKTFEDLVTGAEHLIWSEVGISLGSVQRLLGRWNPENWILDIP